MKQTLPQPKDNLREDPDTLGLSSRLYYVLESFYAYTSFQTNCALPSLVPTLGCADTMRVGNV